MYLSVLNPLFKTNLDIFYNAAHRCGTANGPDLLVLATSLKVYWVEFVLTTQAAHTGTKSRFYARVVVGSWLPGIDSTLASALFLLWVTATLWSHFRSL